LTRIHSQYRRTTSHQPLFWVYRTAKDSVVINLTADIMPEAVIPPPPTGDKWLDTVAQAQAASKNEKPDGVHKDPKKSEKLSKIDIISGSTWDSFCPPPSNSFKVSSCGFLALWR
jgi:hypothetical protein